MKLVSLSLFIAMSFVLVGCSNTRSLPIEQLQTHYLDNEFTSNRKLESTTELFSSSPAIDHYVKSRLDKAKSTKQKIDLLLHDLFAPERLNIRYQHNANYVPQDVFSHGQANCMSLTLLTYVITKEAGLLAEFMSVEVEENWNVANDVTLLNGHVNLLVAPPNLDYDGLNKLIYSSGKTYTIDFLPMLSGKSKKRYVLTKAQMQALFYNNKGADALANQNPNLAYQYFKAATLLAPTLSETWGNLASLYRQSGFIKEAESIYLLALKIEPNSLNLKENLALLYKLTGRKNESHALYAEVKEARKHNPYYFAMQGEEALNRGELALASSQFSKAVRLNRKEAQLLLWVGQGRQFAGGI